MRIATWFLFFLCVLLAGVGIYLYAFLYTPAVAALADLERENERLLGMKKPPEGLKVENPAIKQEGPKVVYPTDKIFLPGTPQISKEGESILTELASELKKEGYSEITVACYTDASPVITNTDKYPSNWELAGARSAAVVRFLISKGIPDSILYAVSYGPTRPVASNSTPEGRSQNRRLEIRAR
ncbi:MAG: OmpA family protein [candidate division WOR-3 bacterium]